VKPAGTTGKAARRYPHKPVTTHIAPAPTRGGKDAFSSRNALYLYHKANGTLHEFYRMFGLD
jgi:hypothetical protein